MYQVAKQETKATSQQPFCKTKVEDQLKTNFTPGNGVNVINVYKLDVWLQHLNIVLTLKDRLFGAIKLFIKNNDPDEYFYSGYGTGFCSC